MDTAGVVGNHVERQFSLDFDWSLEKQAEVLLRDFQDLYLLGGEVAQQEEVDCSAILRQASGLELVILGEGLARFWLTFKPVAGLGRRKRLGEGPQRVLDLEKRETGGARALYSRGKGSQ